MSNLIDINELRKEFAEKLSSEEWQNFAAVQNSIIDTYEKEITFLKEKCKHLENILISQSKPLITELSSEESICIHQIDRLEKVSNERQLTLEEVKKLDLLVKNLKLVREESTVVVNSRKVDNISEAELVAIAKSETTSR